LLTNSTRSIPKKAQDEIVQFVASFALYGFPESHAASFALIRERIFKGSIFSRFHCCPPEQLADGFLSSGHFP
jgi:error-prone DNA polymerase